MGSTDDLMWQRKNAKDGQTLRRFQEQASRLISETADPTRDIALALIVADAEIQVRTGGLDQEKVGQYVVVLQNGGMFPPIDVFEVGDRFYVADGFHRLEAHRRHGATEIRAVVRAGQYEDAQAFAEDANLRHGMNLSNEDKKAIMWRRLARGFWRPDELNWRAICGEFGVAHTTIGRWYDEWVESVKKGLIANAPMPETLPEELPALKRYRHTREANKKRGPNKLQKRQRVIRDLRRVADDFAELGMHDQATAYTEWADGYAEEWGLE